MGQTTRPGRVLGLDLGDVRIGVAISDDDRRMAVPLGTIHTGAPADLKAIAKLVEEHAATTVVVGLPLSMTGERGPAAVKAGSFAEALRSFLHVPVELHDERLSTVEAERALREAGVSDKRRRHQVDEVAATVILQAWLDARCRTD
jgi:putative Holliday junction resolvase